MFYETTLWTSKLSIFIKQDIEQSLVENYCDIISKDIEKEFNSFDKTSAVSRLNEMYPESCEFRNELSRLIGRSKSVMFTDDYSDDSVVVDGFQSLQAAAFVGPNIYEFIRDFVSYKHDGSFDFTGMLKGLFIDRLSKLLSLAFCENYMINFGGDILCKKLDLLVNISEKFEFRTNRFDTFLIASSGNNEFRGEHIKTEDSKYKQSTMIFRNRNSLSMTLVDMLSTMLYARPEDFRDKWLLNAYILQIEAYSGKVHFLRENYVYIASPFFNEKEIEVRDKMLNFFTEYRRPDLTESGMNYDKAEHTADSANKVVDDNISLIKSGQCIGICFPFGTSDLGTLFEIGIAQSINDMCTFRYDHFRDKMTLVFLDTRTFRDQLGQSRKEILNVVDCSSVAGAVFLGYIYGSTGIDKKSFRFAYDIKNSHDNIMLRMNFDRISNGKILHEIDFNSIN